MIKDEMRADLKKYLAYLHTYIHTYIHTYTQKTMIKDEMRADLKKHLTDGGIICFSAMALNVSECVCMYVCMYV